ncbi:putative methyltransferase NSUN7 [Takifugu rubripes]|nr:putative methyltransferase NSUN7 [Takifugu rubripes]
MRYEMMLRKNKRLHKRASQQQRDVQAKAQTSPAPQEHPSTGAVPAPFACPEVQAQSQSHQEFPDRIYLLASVIFQNLHPEKPAMRKLVNYGNKRRLPLPEVKFEERPSSYELAFNTLKYQDFLEGMIINSFGVAPPISNDDMSLFVVMLYDLQSRKFLPRQHQENEETIPDVTLVERVILGFKTKLAASLARHRIKHQLLSVESFLPETVKLKQERSLRLPIYAWVNALKSSPEEIQRVLRSAGFCQVKSIRQLVDRTFCWDHHCRDVLVFPALCRSQLYSTGLLSDCKLVIQDKSCSLGPQAVFSLLPDDADVLLVGHFSGLTLSHTAALIAQKDLPYGAQQPTVYACVSDHTEAQRAELQQTMTAMGCKNVTLIPEDFQSLGANDKRLQRLLVIFLTPECSLSAVSNPVELILQENRDLHLLQDLSQGSISPKKLATLVVEQRKAVDHALKFPKVSAVVYSTHSSHAEENEEVVKGALQRFQASFGETGEPELARLRSPSPFSIFKEDEGLEKKDSFFMLEPSEESNGCFLAVLNREPKPVVKETPREVILRAYTTGLLDGIGSKHGSGKTSQNYPEVMKKYHNVLDSDSGPVMSVQTSPPSTKSSWVVTRGHQLTSHTQSSQAKTKQLQGVKTSKDAGSVPAAPLRQKPNPPSSSKPDHTTFKKTIPRLPASSRAADVTPAVRPHLEPKPVELTLPVVHFKPFSLHSRGWKPNQKDSPSGFNQSKSVRLNSKPLFGMNRS